MTDFGHKYALKGFRLQTLFILYKFCTTKNVEQLIFHPENVEDLAVLSSDNSILELYQVKDYGDGLTLSDFKPKKENSFFRRILKYPQAKKSIISFGQFGPEMNSAWASEGKDRDSIAGKFKDFEFREDEIESIFSSVTLIPVEEVEIFEKVRSFLLDSPVGGDPENAFDLLSFWLYKASEDSKQLKYSNLIDKLNSVGAYLAERATYKLEWFTSINPIEDVPVDEEETLSLADEFYQGVGARYEHILAGVDVVRGEKLEEIDNLFNETNVVVVHGASGQGKTTLAYRYLHSYIPEKWRFRIDVTDDPQHPLRIARAISGHHKVVDSPVYIYIDVEPENVHWTTLLKSLSSERNIFVLVTIREEDWKRSYISESVRIKEIELEFDDNEASWLFSELETKQKAHSVLNFDEAWQRFGNQGPLLEFVYLVTQNESLQERLTNQVNRLKDEVRRKELAENEFTLLRMVSVASAYGSSLDTQRTSEYLALSVPERTIELFEKEYLLQQDESGNLGGLHEIRSNILVDLLTDNLNVWRNIAENCLPLINENQLEIFLLHTFSRREADIDYFVNLS